LKDTKNTVLNLTFYSKHDKREFFLSGRFLKIMSKKAKLTIGKGSMILSGRKALPNYECG
jgi:hypothetical protein